MADGVKTPVTGSEPRAIHALMSGLIDYAGLFPPAKLPMQACVANYAKYLGSPESWMLGRFIVPVSRIEEFRKEAAGGGGLLPKRMDEDDPASAPWPISALSDGDLDEDLDAIFAFNGEHADARNGLAVIDAVEIKVPVEEEEKNPPRSGGAPGAPSVDFIENALEIMAEGVYPFFELPLGPDLRGAIASLAGADAAAKVRTGGVTPESIPSSKRVAEFIVACAQADVPFKATAGLHHPVRAEFNLTYEKGCPRAVMHGFLNVFVAAAMVQAYRLGAEDAAKILDELDPRAFVFEDGAGGGISWGPGRLGTEQIERARELFALSFGSCSFEEPVGELRGLGLI